MEVSQYDCLLCTLDGNSLCNPLTSTCAVSVTLQLGLGLGKLHLGECASCTLVNMIQGC